MIKLIMNKEKEGLELWLNIEEGDKISEKIQESLQIFIEALAGHLETITHLSEIK